MCSVGTFGWVSRQSRKEDRSKRKEEKYKKKKKKGKVNRKEAEYKRVANLYCQERVKAGGGHVAARAESEKTPRLPRGREESGDTYSGRELLFGGMDNESAGGWFSHG